jgi:hypothetical protein
VQERYIVVNFRITQIVGKVSKNIGRAIEISINKDSGCQI